MKALIGLAVWAVVSVPVALLLACIFRDRSLLVSRPCGAAAPANLTQVRHLLELIAGAKCQKVTGGSRCWDDATSTPDCPWTADRWCDACTAQVALDALNSSFPVTTPGDEAAPRATHATTQAVARGASNFLP